MSEDARAYALRLLSQRPYTTRDLTRKLHQREFTPEEIEPTIARLLEAGLLDDRKYALNFARTRLTGTSSSPRRVSQLLAKKGIDPSMAKQAAVQVIEEENIDTRAGLERVARRKLLVLAGLERHVATRRLYGFLARRGYDLEEIREVVAKISGAHSAS